MNHTKIAYLLYDSSLCSRICKDFASLGNELIRLLNFPRPLRRDFTAGYPSICRINHYCSVQRGERLTFFRWTFRFYRPFKRDFTAGYPSICHDKSYYHLARRQSLFIDLIAVTCKSSWWIVFQFSVFSRYRICCGVWSFLCVMSREAPSKMDFEFCVTIELL